MDTVNSFSSGAPNEFSSLKPKKNNSKKVWLDVKLLLTWMEAKWRVEL
jgi:hypothetical protein